MKYINKREYQKIVDYAPNGVSKSDITKSLVAKGYKIQGVNDQESLGFGKQLIKDIASPFVRGGQVLKTGLPVAGAVLAGVPSALGIGDKDKARERIMSAAEKAQASQKEQIKTRIGTYNPVTNPKEAIGVGLEGASAFVGGGGLASLGKAGIRGLLKQAVIGGAKSGAVAGSTFGVGRALSEDESTTSAVQGGLIGGIGGALGGGLLGGTMTGGSLAIKAIKNKITQKLQPVSEQVKQRVTDYIGKAIKPRTSGLSTNQLKNIQRKQVEGFQVLKNNLKDVRLPDEFGGLTSRAPRTVQELVKAVDDVKVKLFSRYDKLAREAGDKGASFNPIKTIGEMTKFTKDKSYSPSLRKYANEILEEVSELKGESPLVIQSRIKELNESLAGYFAGRVEKGRARIDASVAKLLNEELDDVIFNFTAGDYKALRSQFSALKSIEKDATRTAQRMLNRQKKGLGDLTDIFTGGDLISGILTANPSSVSRGLIGKGIQLAYKALNDPDRYIRKIFNELGETAQPQRLINRDLPSPSGKLSPTDAIPLPKGKGEILKSTPLKSKADNLIQEAKKYKSADEFVKAQEISPIQKKKLLGSGEPIIVHRGISSSGKNFYKGDKELPFTYYSLDKTKASKYGNVSDYIFDSSGKTFRGSLFEKFGINADIEDINIINKLKSEGYGSIIVKGDELIVFDKNLIKTKSQLTDIWNKANKK